MSGIAILCSGQGRQNISDFQSLLKYPEAKSFFDEVIKTGILPEPLDSYLNGKDFSEGLLFENEYAQPFIVLYQLMLWEILKINLQEPEIFTGYSLGELSIYGMAEIIKKEDLIGLSAARGKLMSKAADKPQGMAAIIGLKQDCIKKICDNHGAHIAIINAEDHFVCGMEKDRINIFLDECRKAGATKTVELPVSVASHTPFMERASFEFSKLLDKVDFKGSSSNILAGTNGEKLFSITDMRNALTAQISNPIDWRACMEGAVSYGCRVFLETGPGNNLSRMIIENFPDIEARSISDFHDINTVNVWVNAALRRQY